MLQEPTNDVVNLAHTQSLVISALKRALPEIVVKIDVSYTSSGRGTSWSYDKNEHWIQR